MGTSLFDVRQFSTRHDIRLGINICDMSWWLLPIACRLELNRPTSLYLARILKKKRSPLNFWKNTPIEAKTTGRWFFFLHPSTRSICDGDELSKPNHIPIHIPPRILSPANPYFLLDMRSTLFIQNNPNLKLRIDERRKRKLPSNSFGFVIILQDEQYTWKAIDTTRCLWWLNATIIGKNYPPYVTTKTIGNS